MELKWCGQKDLVCAERRETRTSEQSLCIYIYRSFQTKFIFLQQNSSAVECTIPENIKISRNVKESNRCIPRWGEGDPHSFYLRTTNYVTKWYLRHALTRIDSDPHPFSLPARSLYLYFIQIPNQIFFLLDNQLIYPRKYQNTN